MVAAALISQVVKPGGKLAVSVTKMHNALFHIANNIKGFAAARLGAPEIDSPSMREGLPIVEIFRTSSNAPNGRAVIARADCVDGLPRRAARVRAQFTAAQLHAFELILGALAMRMLVRLEALHTDRALTGLGGAAPSCFHLVMLAHAMLLTQDPAGAEPVPLLHPSRLDADRSAAASVSPQELLELGLSFYGVLWTRTLLFHARKHHVAHEMMRKYNPPHVPQHPCLVPGFMLLLPVLGEALRAHVCTAQSFPQYVPPGPLGDWRRV